ncbi:isochorismatase-like protein [Aureococcus anophagefferens]|nr:isochorismatase-like protein [Aureococcus anophagefferens]
MSRAEVDAAKWEAFYEKAALGDGLERLYRAASTRRSFSRFTSLSRRRSSLSPTRAIRSKIKSTTNPRGADDAPPDADDDRPFIERARAARRRDPNHNSQFDDLNDLIFAREKTMAGKTATAEKTAAAGGEDVNPSAPADLVEARHKVAARPFAFPLGGDALDPATTALLVIDLQRDFCDEGGYMGAMGYDVAPLREPLPKVRAVLRACRARSIRCFHTRQGYRPDLADLSAFARRKFERAGVTVGAAGPLGRLFVRGEPGSEIVEDARPREGEPVIDKTANDAFIGTDLDRLLRLAGISRLVVVGNTLDCCVHSTLRHANDLDYETLLLSDCCGCSAFSARPRLDG